MAECINGLALRLGSKKDVNLGQIINSWFGAVVRTDCEHCFSYSNTYCNFTNGY